MIMAGAWAWLLSPLNDPSHPDELSDEDFVAAAEVRCERFVDEIDALPNANTAGLPAERALLIDDGTQLTLVLVEDLRRIAPDPTTEEGEIVARWLADWEIYISDRNAYAERLRGGESGPFPVTARDGEQISEYIEAFAIANSMFSCVVPLDV